jgi:hypothetical protein
MSGNRALRGSRATLTTLVTTCRTLVASRWEAATHEEKKMAEIRST